jgi:uncharacterized protein (TIGR04255 family)
MTSSAEIQWEVFPKAPIVEAVVDLRAALPSQVSIETLAAFHDRIREDFPHREVQVEYAAQVRISADASTATGRQRQTGFRFSSDDRHWAVQARLDGFTLNYFAPYASWSTLRQRAATLWAHYLEVARPVAVERTGLRYVNRVHVPIGANLSDYFEIEPRLGSRLPQTMAWFNVQVAIEVPDLPAMVLIQQRRGEDSAEHPGQAAVFLDIDTFTVSRLDPNSDQIWQVLDQLRDLKNQVFFNAITEKTKEAFR